MLAVLGLCIALVQLTATWYGWQAASWVGAKQGLGYGVALILGGSSMGYITMYGSWYFIIWAIMAAPLAIGLSLIAGSYLGPPPHPDMLFAPSHHAHAGYERVNIPHEGNLMPGVLIKPHAWQGMALVFIPGAGDNKTGFKWRLVQSLLNHHFLVLTIDPPGHGEYFDQPMLYPDALSCVTTAVTYLQQQVGVKQIGLIGFSLGGAIAIRALAENPTCQVAALAVIATPIELRLNRSLVWLETWNTGRAPVLSLWREMSLRQLRHDFMKGRYHSPHSVSQMIALLDPPSHLPTVAQRQPTLLVYSEQDVIAPLTTGRRLHKLAPETTLLEIKKASHVTIILIREVNEQVGRWLAEQMEIYPPQSPRHQREDITPSPT